MLHELITRSYRVLFYVFDFDIMLLMVYCCIFTSSYYYDSTSSTPGILMFQHAVSIFDGLLFAPHFKLRYLRYQVAICTSMHAMCCSSGSWLDNSILWFDPNGHPVSVASYLPFPARICDAGSPFQAHLETSLSTRGGKSIPPRFFFFFSIQTPRHPLNLVDQCFTLGLVVCPSTCATPIGSWSFGSNSFWVILRITVHLRSSFHVHALSAVKIRLADRSSSLFGWHKRA